MADGFEERRRNARVVMGTAQELRLERSVRVRILDLSLSGALLWTDEDLPVGSCGRLSVLLGGARFEGQVQIKREEFPEPTTGRLLGTVLIRSQPRQQRALEQFISRGRSR